MIYITFLHRIRVYLVIFCLVLGLGYTGSHVRAATDTDKPGIKQTELSTLTTAERKWVKQRKTKPIIIGAEMDWPPFDFVKNNRPTGFSNELVRLAARKAGVPFRFKFGLTWAELLEEFNQGDIDVLPAVYKTPARERKMTFTQRYAANPSVLIGHVKNQHIRSFDDLVGKKLAVVEGFSINQVIKETHPRIEQLPVKSALEALKAVSLEKVDAFVGSLGVISHILKENFIPDIKVVDEVSLGDPEVTQLHMAVLKDRKVLRNIIQKGLDAVTATELNELRATWLGLGLIKQERQRPYVTLSATEKAWIKSHPVLKVATTQDWPPFEFIDNAGKYSGITADVLRLAAKRTGLELDLALNHSWKENYAKLKTGALDVGPGMGKTSERVKFLVFTKPFITSEYAIYAKQGRKDISTVEDFAGKTIAVEEGYMFHEYLAETQPKAKLLLTSNTLEALKAVIRGAADAYLGTLPVASYLIEQQMLNGLKVVGYYEGIPFQLYMGVKKDRPILRDILQKGLDTISEHELAEIKRFYFSETFEKNMVLTDKEKQWLQRHKNIRLGVDPAWLPFEGIDSDGNYMGIVSEYVNWLNQKLPLTMSPVQGVSWQEVITKAKAREIDVLPGVGITPARKEYLNFTQSYLKIPIVLVTRVDMPFVSGIEGLAGKRFAIIANAPMANKLKTEHPELNYLETKNLSEALQAVADGEADATLGNNASLTYYIRRGNIKGLKVVASLPETLDLSFGVRKDWPLFVSILNKALATIPDIERRSFQDRWMNVQVSFRIDWRTVWGISLVIFLVAGAVLTVILYSNRKLANEVQERTLAERKTRAMSEAIHDALVMIDSKAHIMYWNHAAEQMFDLPASEAMGRDLHALIAPEDSHKQAWSGLKTFAQSGQGPVVGNLQEVQAIRSDGQAFPAEVAVSGFKVGDKWHAVGTIRDITDRKAAEDELRTNEQRFRAFFDNSIMGVTISSPDGAWIEISDRFLEMSGYNVSELEAITWQEITHPDDLKADLDRYKTMLAGDIDSYTMDKRFVCKDGSILYTNLGISCVRNTRGEVELVLASFLDITDRKQAETELKNSQKRLAQIIDSLPDPTFVIDNEGVVTAWNHAMVEITGISTKDMIGKGNYEYALPFYGVKRPILIDLVHEWDGSLKEKYFSVLEKEEGVLVSESFHPDLNGGIYLAGIAKVLYDIDGKPAGAIESIRDITEAHEFQEALKQSEARVKTILDSVNTGIIVINPENRTIVDVNPVAATMIETAPENIIGKVCHLFICPREKNDCPILDHENQAIDNSERILLTATGREVPILKTVVPVELDGKTRLLESFVDISERKIAEEELQRNLDELERFSKLTINREERMIALKEEINALLKRLGESEKYKIVD